MDPVTLGVISVAAKHIFDSIKWDKIDERVETDAASGIAKILIRRLQPDDRKRASREAIALFIEEFHRELEAKLDLSANFDGQISRLVESAALDIAAWMRPDTKDVDLAPVERMWKYLGLDPLPDFDWHLVAQNYARAIQAYVRKDPQLRAELHTALLEEIAEAVGGLRGPAPGFDLTGYRDFLRRKCGPLQLAAMHASTYRYDRQITLWSVFVAQSARESVPVRELPRGLLRRLRQEHQIVAERDERDTDELRQHYQESAVLPVLDIFARERLVVVLGDPGSGKTSLLKFLVMRWVNTDQAPIPLWIDLKEYAEERNGLLKYCESGCAAFGLDAREVEKRLQASEAALYLDGLDEIFDGPTRGRVIEEVAAFTARYPRARVVVTSRLVGYEPERLRNAGFTHATLEDFDDPQVSEFLRKWHEAAEESTAERARLTAQLDRAFRESRAVRDLAGNPMLLTMMAILNRNQDLPRDRVELYREASRVLLHEWDASRSLPYDTFARQEQEELLRELAGAMQQAEGGLAGNLIDRDRLVDLFRGFLKNLGVSSPHEKAIMLVKQLIERNFILCYAGAERFSFVHRTFLEYFCAAWFVDLFQKKQTLTLDQLKTQVFGPHWKDETWHEVLRLIAGMVGEKQAEQLILFLMEQDGRRYKLANLMLAAGCLSEVRSRRAMQATDEGLRRLFVENVISYDPPYYIEPYEEESETAPTRQKAVGLIAFVWRSERTRAWLATLAERDVDWTARRAAVQELARGWKDHPGTLPMVRDLAYFDEDEDVRRSAVQEFARGWKDDPGTLIWLKDRAGDEGGLLRSPALQELARGWKDDPDTPLMLRVRARSDKSAWVRRAAVQELARGWTYDSETLLIVKDRVSSNEDTLVRSAAVQELARGWKEDPDTLSILTQLARSDENPGVRIAALQELERGWKYGPDTLKMLKDSGRSDESPFVRSAAVEELAHGWRGDLDILTWLKECPLSDENASVRYAAVRGLAQGWKADPDTVATLKNRAHSDDSYEVRRAAVQELARGWKDNPDTLTWLKCAARSNENADVRRAALQGLSRGWSDDPHTLPILKERVRSDRHAFVRITAVRELARNRREDPDALSIIRDRARSDKSAYVRRAALRELARSGKDDPETPAIVKDRVRSDENGDVRRAAISELVRGWRGDSGTLLILKNCAQTDADDDVRAEAVVGLAQKSRDDPGALAALKDRARLDASPGVRILAMYELARRWSDDPDTLPLLKDRARSDENEFVRKSALEALARRWRKDTEVVAMLAAQRNLQEP
jgi:predicted NACHT family NTPase